MPYALKQAFAAYQRSPLLGLLSVVSVSLSLFVVGLFALTAFNIRQAITLIESRVEVVAYLKDDTTPDQVKEATEEMLALPTVREVHFVSKEEALTTAREELPEFEGIFNDLEANPLPASLEIGLVPGQRDEVAMRLVADRMAAHDYVEGVDYGGDLMGKIIQLRRIAAGGTAIIGGAFAAVAGIIIATAIRIAVFARREEIHIMRLVGATTGFIQRPFLLEGLISGTIGGILAGALTYAAYQAVSAALIPVDWLPAGWVVAGILVGGAYGLVSSAIAVNRHLRRV